MGADVFMKETEVIERLFLKRFDTSGRSLVMVIILPPRSSIR
jgi:hypothetical protein